MLFSLLCVDRVVVVGLTKDNLLVPPGGHHASPNHSQFELAETFKQGVMHQAGKAVQWPGPSCAA